MSRNYSRSRCSVSAHGERSSKNEKSASYVPDMLALVESRDYAGPIALLQIKLQADAHDKNALEWLAFCYFHNQDYDEALTTYKQLLLLVPDLSYNTYIAACLFRLGLYTESEEALLKGPECPMQKRILFHIAHRKNDEKSLMRYHENLGESMEDQLNLAAMHFLRMHYEEAIEVYKRFFLEHRDVLALNVYIALCYYKLDKFDVSMELLNKYLQACNTFRLFNGKSAEAIASAVADRARSAYDTNVLNHNLVVYRNGNGSLQVFPPLVDILPEARINLVTYYMRKNESQQAYEVMKEYEPTSLQEYVIKAIASASLGQETASRELVKMAQQFFHLVGASPSECDTVLGRQCMASSFFLLEQFDDALIYLESVKSFLEDQEEFHWNYGMSKAATGNYLEAEKQLLKLGIDKYAEDFYYQSWLCRCFIMNGKAQLAWDQFVQMDTSEESISLLQLIANDCYQTGQFLYAAKSFDALEKMDTSENYWEGKRGACIGLFRNVVACTEPIGSLGEIVALLRSTSHPQVESILRIIQIWTKENEALLL
ncbi:hypothetical protein O6H91_Y351200 [Diphasiastrum complanatum]|nr:hypothetical protein O6H91_Y351200 [Diphasiastrum complanatum]